MKVRLAWLIVSVFEGLLCSGWYRCQIVSYDKETEMCDIKYLDYGGYHSISVHSLRQIRTDFLSLPFQVMTENQ